MEMEKPTTQATVVLLRDRDGRICLARKKQAIHHEGGTIEYSLGMYNGYGGKMENDDATIFHAAIRELYDEAGVTATLQDLVLAARVYFYVKKEDILVPFMNVSFFFLDTWNGDPKEGDEMGTPTFFAAHEIPYHEMMPADKPLIEGMLRGVSGVYQVNLFGKHAPPEVIELGEVLK